MSNGDGITPQLLLVEDDPTSRSFMAAVLEALPAQVDAVDSIAAALTCTGSHDLWLLDANLPDGSGIELLARLRERHANTIALAHTADDSPALGAQLLAAGFAAVVLKPLTARELQGRVLHWLGTGASPSLRVAESPFMVHALWDDTVALSALSGNRENLAVLRRMFVQELGRQHSTIITALRQRDLPSARHELHQLKASSGFVGALRLNAAAAQLENDLEDGDRVAEFDQTLQQTLASVE